MPTMATPPGTPTTKPTVERGADLSVAGTRGCYFLPPPAVRPIQNGPFCIGLTAWTACWPTHPSTVQASRDGRDLYTWTKPLAGVGE